MENTRSKSNVCVCVVSECSEPFNVLCEKLVSQLIVCECILIRESVTESALRVCECVFVHRGV